MRDIFDAKISCKSCDREMKPVMMEKHGFRLRAVQCPRCDERIIHPSDMKDLNHYNDLKRKTYNVKLRVVGNSHAISIPKEIVEFINDTNRRLSKQMDDMVKLCFEDFGRLSVNFIEQGDRREKRWQKTMG